jgi:class 3 adenylate cyclase
METAKPTCLVIADISGYTSYLAGVELDHANDILADLMNTVVTAFRPVFKLSKVEGDAAFVYAPPDRLDGSILLDKVEGCYFAFRRRLLSIRQASTCECNACLLIPGLDLKVVAHYGPAIPQTIAGRTDLVGHDVNVAHRLLKNSIPGRAYAFYTDACLQAVGLDGEALEMNRHVEEFDNVGEVGGWWTDLQRAFNLETERNRVYVSEADAASSFTVEVPTTTDHLWELVTSPTKRPLWQVGITEVIQQDGRRRLGTQNHCMHGKDMVLQEIIDWRAPRYITTKNRFGGIDLVMTEEVMPTDRGATYSLRAQRPRSKKAEAALTEVLAGMGPVIPLRVERLLELVRAEAVTDSAAEPELPTPDESSRLATSIATV